MVTVGGGEVEVRSSECDENGDVADVGGWS